MTDRFTTILADPPWDIYQRGGQRRGTDEHYELMAAADIGQLPVDRMAEPDAYLWIRVTNASVFTGRQILEQWGFTYRSILTGIKPRFGMGQYLRTQAEHLLLGTRGRAQLLFRGHGSWSYAPVQEHSHKPEEQYAIIERCSPGPYAELFARRSRPGWHVWGNQVASDVDL